MISFLTSSPCLKGETTLNSANGFAEKLKSALPKPCSCLFICSDPDGYEFTDGFAKSMKGILNEAGIVFSDYKILDGRNEKDAEIMVKNSDFIILAGGHVPTQNRFFNKIGLQKIIKEFEGVVLGISAGTMNCACVVYAQPELPGEALSPDYKRFLSGLGITDITVIPHYQDIKNNVLDGLRVFEDITYPDSFGRCFYALTDGSYIYINGNIRELYGEAYVIEDGSIRRISKNRDILNLS